jgi:hypothetical protein
LGVQSAFPFVFKYLFDGNSHIISLSKSHKKISLSLKFVCVCGDKYMVKEKRRQTTCRILCFFLAPQALEKAPCGGRFEEKNPNKRENPLEELSCTQAERLELENAMELIITFGRGRTLKD